MPHNPHTSLGQPFIIRRLDTAGYRLNPQIPSTVAQSDCFLYLRAGEVLTDVGAEPVLVVEGQVLYIPSGLAFSIKYYNGSLGYMGAFSSCILEAPHLGLLGRTGPVLIDIPEDERGLVVSLAEKLVRELKKCREKDKRLGFCSVGPHRDDIAISLNGLDGRKFASQGQQRSVALAMKLAEAEMYKREKGEYPVMLLDDVLSELDRDRQRTLIRLTSGMQTLLTCTEPPELGVKAKKFRIGGEE